MKTIYMAQTLNLMANGKHKEAQELISSGEVKELETGEKYLIIQNGEI